MDEPCSLVLRSCWYAGKLRRICWGDGDANAHTACALVAICSAATKDALILIIILKGGEKEKIDQFKNVVNRVAHIG